MIIFSNYWKTRVVRYPLLALGALAATVATGARLDLGKSDWAAWVQAIGTIVALGVAIFVMRGQNAAAAKLAVDADLRTHQRRARSVSALVYRAERQISNCVDAVRSVAREGNQAHMRTMLRNANKVLSARRSALEQIPAHDLGSYEMVEGLLGMIGCITVFEKIIDDYLSDPRVNMPTDQIANRMDVVTEGQERSSACFAEGLRQLGVLPPTPGSREGSQGS